MTLYPNPTSNQFKIDFSIDKNEKVNVSIYNTLGMKLLNPINSNFENGSHSLPINTDSLSNGVYIVKIEIGNQSKDVKLVISK